MTEGHWFKCTWKGSFDFKDKLYIIAILDTPPDGRKKCAGVWFSKEFGPIYAERYTSDDKEWKPYIPTRENYYQALKALFERTQ
jgi:hypothetical protein